MGIPKLSLPTIALPKSITDKLDNASASIRAKLPTIPETSRTTKVAVGTVAALAAGTVAYVNLSDKQKSRLSNICTKIANAVKAGVKSAVEFAKEHDTAVKVGAAALVTVGGGAFLYKRSVQAHRLARLVDARERLWLSLEQA